MGKGAAFGDRDRCYLDRCEDLCLLMEGGGADRWRDRIGFRRRATCHPLSRIRRGRVVRPRWSILDGREEGQGRSVLRRGMIGAIVGWGKRAGPTL